MKPIKPTLFESALQYEHGMKRCSRVYGKDSIAAIKLEAKFEAVEMILIETGFLNEYADYRKERDVLGA